MSQQYKHVDITHFAELLCIDVVVPHHALNKLDTYINGKSSTKPEVHNILKHRERIGPNHGHK